MSWKERLSHGCFTFQMCCMFDGQYGSRCWSSYFTFEDCCALAVNSDNHRHIPFWHSKQVLVKLHERFRPHSVRAPWGLLRINQDVPETEWQVYRPERVPLVLWESGYMMMRWMEERAIASNMFRDQRVLELGAGIGLAAILASLAGASVVATDASNQSVQLIRKNVRTNLGDQGRITALALNWTQIVNFEDPSLDALDARSRKELARKRLADARVPGHFDIVVCAALGYVPVSTFHALLGILDLTTDKKTIVLWGAGKEATIHLNKSWNRDEKAVELAKAFKVQSELGDDRPSHQSHLNLFELRRRASWRGAPIFHRTAP